MKTKYIILFLIILLAAGIGFYLYQDDKRQKTLHAYNMQKFQQAYEDSQKSNRAGLLIMASAIKRFQMNNGRYPQRLDELYPELVPHEGFIRNLEWTYTSKGNSYILKKVIKGSRFVSSVGPDLKIKTTTLQDDKSGEMLAAAKPSKKPAVIQTVKPEVLGVKTMAPVAKVSVGRQMNPDQAGSRLKLLAPLAPEKIPEPKIKIVKEPLRENEQYLSSFNGNKLYIWKTNDGVIGFSNIQYPDNEKVKVYKDNAWVKY